MSLYLCWTIYLEEQTSKMHKICNFVQAAASSSGRFPVKMGWSYYSILELCTWMWLSYYVDLCDLVNHNYMYALCSCLQEGELQSAQVLCSILIDPGSKWISILNVSHKKLNYCYLKKNWIIVVKTSLVCSDYLDLVNLPKRAV